MEHNFGDRNPAGWPSVLVDGLFGSGQLLVVTSFGSRCAGDSDG